MTAKYGDHHVPQGEFVDELVIFSPAVFIGYNAAGEIVQIKKKTAAGGTFVREIVDREITDYEIDRWVEYTRYRKVRGG